MRRQDQVTPSFSCGLTVLYTGTVKCCYSWALSVVGDSKLRQITSKPTQLQLQQQLQEGFPHVAQQLLQRSNPIQKELKLHLYLTVARTNVFFNICVCLYKSRTHYLYPLLLHPYTLGLVSRRRKGPAKKTKEKTSGSVPTSSGSPWHSSVSRSPQPNI